MEVKIKCSKTDKFHQGDSVLITGILDKSGITHTGSLTCLVAPIERYAKKVSMQTLSKKVLMLRDHTHASCRNDEIQKAGKVSCTQLVQSIL